MSNEFKPSERLLASTNLLRHGFAAGLDTLPYTANGLRQLADELEKLLPDLLREGRYAFLEQAMDREDVLALAPTGNEPQRDGAKTVTADDD